MHIIAAFPGVFALWIALNKGAAQAFISVYLPVLFLLPTYFRWFAPGLPDPSFHHAAIIPIAGVWLFMEPKRWRFSTMDVVIVIYAVSICLSEFMAAGYKEAQNLIIDMLAAVVLPYFLAKGLIVPNGLSVAFGRRIVILLFVVSVVSLWEFRMGFTPWGRILNPFFPGQNDWVTTFRWGMVRIAGPYGHAILAGLILVVGYRLQRWLHWRGHWEKQRHAQIITIGLLGGVIMTMVKGPWLGAFAGFGIILIGRSKKPKVMLMALLSIVVIVGIPALMWIQAWVSVGRENAESDTQETAAYRYELFEKYGDVAMDHAWFGWGRNTWPKVQGMPSIDNNYLLLLMKHGLIALAAQWFLFFWMCIRLMIRGVRGPPGSEARVLSFTLASIYLIYFVALATVYMGGQTIQLLFLITGWSEGLLVYKEKAFIDHDNEEQVIPAPTKPFEFKRVLS